MTTSASDILKRCIAARARRWQNDDKRIDLENYYNGGELPNAGCGKDIDSLGLGNRHLRRPHKLLRSTIELDDGPMEVTVSESDDFEKASCSKAAIEKESKDWCQRNFRTLAAQVAGDFLITGRAFAWRSSKWDARFKFGRPLHDAGVSSDITDDSFWWWAFPFTLTMRDVDNYLNTARGEDNKGGWQKEGLRELKRYILEKPDRTETVTVTESDLDSPFGVDRSNEPLHCYVYFEKSAERTGVDRKVSIKIVSRYSEHSAINKIESRNPKTHSLSVTKKLTLKMGEEEREKVIYSEENAFDSVQECLIQWIEDARISGEQIMDEIGGDGEQFLPRLLMMEGMMNSAALGTSFAMQPHFSSSGDVPKAVMQRLQETGLPAFSFAPRGVGMVDKSNVINSSRAGLELVQALGLSIEEESSSNNMPQSLGQRSKTEFAAEAQQALDSSQEGVTLRFTFWHAGWDSLWEAVGKTLIRTKGWAKADPSYYEVKDFHERFRKAGGKMMDLQKARFTFKSRRLPGGADKSTAMSGFMLILNNPNAPAEQQQWAWKGVIKLLFGCEASEHFDKQAAQPDRNQIESAIMQTTAALSSFIPMEAAPGDDPIVHLRVVHIPALQAQIQMIGQKGYREAEDQARVSALVNHISFDIANVPGTARQEAIGVVQQMVQAFASIPEQEPMDERKMKEADMQLKMAKLQNELENGKSLRENRAIDASRKNQAQEFNVMKTAKTLAQQDQRIAVEEANARRDADRLLESK